MESLLKYNSKSLINSLGIINESSFSSKNAAETTGCISGKSWSVFMKI